MIGYEKSNIQTACGHKQWRGVTLIEVVICIVLVSTMLLATLTASASLIKIRNQTVAGGKASVLVDLYASEIVSQPFRDSESPVFGLETGESASDRDTWDDVDDYHQLSDSPPRNRAGAMLRDYANWKVSITVVPSRSDGSTVTQSDADSAPLRLVTITCDSQLGQVHTESLFVAETAIDTSGAPSKQQNYREHLIEFDDGEQIIISTPLFNRPEAVN